MRCLYCGKELALLKRWTSSGEFCSEAHRQQYQEEYNQLALKRLLQAKPDPKTEVKSAEQKTVTRAPEPAGAPETPKIAVAVETPPQAPPREDPAPAEAGFFIELPVPVASGAAATAASARDFDRQLSPILPSLALDSWGMDLVAAGQMRVEAAARAIDSAARGGEERLENREALRTAPVIDFDLRAGGIAGIVEKSEEPMDILFFPQPPQASPALWRADEKDLAFPPELGALARIAFRTTGIEDNESGDSLAPVELPVPPPQAAPRPLAARAAGQSAPVAAVAEAPADAPDNSPAAVPPPATKPLPLTLHGLAAGRGKPVQVFPSAIPAVVDLQAPRSNGLPLRPVMTFGPAPAAAIKEAPAKTIKEDRQPAERAAPVKQDSRKQPRPDPRLPNGKPRETQVEPLAAEPAKAPEPVKEPGDKNNFSTPAAKPYTLPDLPLPSLGFETSESFWSKLPVAGKAGFGVGAVLALGLIVFAVSRGGNPASAAGGPQIVEGPALTAPDAGWITDWGAEPGVRREHNISVLRPSLNLTDYRIQFEAQIDTKALGWVYRAVDGKNYYVNKLEIVKPGLSPTVALVRFAVINGEEQPRAQFPLSMKLHLDTLYKIRFDAVGDRFTTYVQDQKVDEWTDDRLKMGGIGLYSERDEHMSLTGAVNVVPLVIKK